LEPTAEALKVTAPDLGAAVIRESLSRSGLKGDRVNSLIMGKRDPGGCENESGQAGWYWCGSAGERSGAYRQPRLWFRRSGGCKSAATEIWAGVADCAVVGGMENMDQAPHVMPQARWGVRMGDAKLFDSMLMDGLNDAFQW